MASVSKFAFLRPIAPTIVRIALPEAGPNEYVCCLEMSARSLLDLRAKYGAKGDTDNVGFLFDLLSETLCDDAGALLFLSGEEVREGFGLSLKALERIGGEVMRIAGLKVEEKN